MIWETSAMGIDQPDRQQGERVKNIVSSLLWEYTDSRSILALMKHDMQRFWKKCDETCHLPVECCFIWSIEALTSYLNLPVEMLFFLEFWIHIFTSLWEVVTAKRCTLFAWGINFLRINEMSFRIKTWRIRIISIIFFILFLETDFVRIEIRGFLKFLLV